MSKPAGIRQRFKSRLFSLIGKDSEAVVVCFRSGDDALADAMCEEIQRLEPLRKHFTVTAEEPLSEVHRRLRRYRIGLAPVLFNGDAKYRALRRAALFLAPRKILAYNGRLERHHLRLSAPIASWLFLQGTPLDRIYLRPRWLWPFGKERTLRPAGHLKIEGRPSRPERRGIAVLTPYFPYPLSHGGAVRIFHLVREIAHEFDVTLYAFIEGKNADQDLLPVLAFVTRAFLVEKPRYREPRWSTLRPPEVAEYWSPEMASLLARRDTAFLQTEYTYLASYGGDILVEHDVTFDLYSQVFARKATVAAWWDWWRWRRYERHAVSRFPRVVVMAEKDRKLLGTPAARIIENGVDLSRFEPEAETPGRRLLFIGSFRHFPNIVAFRFLTEQILPNLQGGSRNFELVVVAGPEPWLHWQNQTGTLRPPAADRVRILEFVADVRPLYRDSNLVLVPTLESAGTNVKVLEALAMKRAVLSTSSGCAGLGLEHGITAWVADKPADFAAGIERLLEDSGLRSQIAQAGRIHAERHFDWTSIGRRQRALIRELAEDSIQARPSTPSDLGAIQKIQSASPEAAQWDPASYLEHNCWVVMADAEVAGFLVWRQTAPGEQEILNLAVDPAKRRRNIARRLLEAALINTAGEWFLEVRESNLVARQLYQSLGFRASGRREGYYQNPAETGIVLKVIS